jgi:hypothetical protein
MASGDDAESIAGVMISTTGSSLLMPTSSTWKFSMPIVRLNPLVVAEVDPDEHG